MKILEVARRPKIVFEGNTYRSRKSYWNKNKETHVILKRYHNFDHVVLSLTMSVCCLDQMYRGGQKLLDRHRYQFPTSWLYVDNIEGEWGAYNEIMKRKEAAIQTQVTEPSEY